MEEEAPRHESPLKVEGHLVEEQQLYYKDLQKLFGGTGNDTLTKGGNPARHQLYSFT